MRTTDNTPPTWDLLTPRSIGIFLALALAWIVVALGPDWDSVPLRAAARLAGYVAFVAMLVPYLHIVRRSMRSRRGRSMSSWLRWHIAAAYLAFFMVLLHSRGRSDTPLTLALIWLTWIAMVSGVVGYYGQKLLYLVLPRVVDQEFGLERLEPQRALLLQAAEDIVKKKEMQSGAEVIQTFCAAAVRGPLARPLTFWAWIWRHGGDDGLSENWHERTLAYADDKQKMLINDLWGLVQARRMLDLEYRLHQLGRVWLLVHGPAAWALLVLMIEHAVSSMWYGGF